MKIDPYIFPESEPVWSDLFFYFLRLFLSPSFSELYSFLSVPATRRMGQGASQTITPLDLMLFHFPEFKERAQGFGFAKVKPGCLRTLRELEWPIFLWAVWPSGQCRGVS